MTLRQLARNLGLSPTAVSMALRGSSRISAQTRQRVAAEAAASGFVPNARVSELMSALARVGSGENRTPLAAFALFPEAKPWRHPTFEHLEEVFSGARECAERHGYSLEMLWFQEPGMTPGRFRAILEARGIRGIYCLGSLQPDALLPSDLDRFALVCHAASISSRVHRVASHFNHDCRTVLEELLQRRYGRPGLVFKTSGDRRTDFVYTGTFSGFQERVLDAPHVPILRLEEWGERAFANWFRTHRPDVVVVHHEPWIIRSIERALEQLGSRCPDDVGIALLDKNPDLSRYSGIVQDHRLMGAEAIDMLIARICLNDFGPSSQPKFESVEGYWNEGQTLRSRGTRVGSDMGVSSGDPGRAKSVRHGPAEGAGSADLQARLRPSVTRSGLGSW